MFNKSLLPSRCKTYCITHFWKTVVTSYKSHYAQLTTSSDIKEDSNSVEEISTFSKYVNDLLLLNNSNKTNEIDVNEKLILDMTFGSGNNSTTILNCASAKNISAKIVTSALNFSDHQISKDEALRDSRLQPLPMISTFSSLPTILLNSGYKTKSFDGIVIDTSRKINSLGSYKSDIHQKDALLDLRNESTLSQSELNKPSASASDILQHISERELYKLLKVYGALGNWAKFVAQEIIEARYMFHQFKTVQELRDIIDQASQNIVSSNTLDVSKLETRVKSFSSAIVENSDSKFIDQYSLQEQLTSVLLNQTLIALRILVNDEINELEFALRCVASQFLKPINGTLIVKLNAASEQKVAGSVFTEVQVPVDRTLKEKFNKEEMISLSNRKWKIISSSDSQPLHTHHSYKNVSQVQSIYAARYVD